MAFQTRLFDSDSTHFPNPIEGESLYSWCVRFHRLSTNINPNLTSKQLFDHYSAGFRHDFPTRLSSFSEITNQILGSVEKLIYDRTVFSIFAPFLSQIAIEDVFRNMHNGVHSRIAYRIGLRGTPISTTAPIKACAQCMQEDKIAWGTAWWHIEHQFPTVRICPAHGTYLLMATQEFHSSGLKDWYTPADIPGGGWHNMPPLDAQTIERLRKLSDWTLWLAKHYDNSLDSGLLRQAYQLRAIAMGWSCKDGTLNFTQLRIAFRNSYACLEGLPGFSFIKDTVHDHGGFLGSILLRIGVNKHPLRNLLLMDFLFEDPNVFLAEYKLVLSKSLRCSNAELWPELVNSEDLLKILVTDAGYTVNAAARKLHIPVRIAIRSLKQNSIVFQQGRMIDPTSEKLMISYLVAGDGIEEIASKLGIRKRLIISYLTRNPALQKTWRQAVKDRTIATHRTLFLQFLNDNPSMSAKDIRRFPESGFRWLKINDGNWLKENLPGIWNQAANTDFGR